VQVDNPAHMPLAWFTIAVMGGCTRFTGHPELTLCWFWLLCAGMCCSATGQTLTHPLRRQ
jgi:hypothetical protein